MGSEAPTDRRIDRRTEIALGPASPPQRPALNHREDQIVGTHVPSNTVVLEDMSQLRGDGNLATAGLGLRLLLDGEFQAALSLPPITAPSPARDDNAMPSGGTDGQTSRWRQMEWRDGGEDRGGLVTAD